MIVFEPKKGIKPILEMYKFLSLILIPTFMILIYLKTSFKEWLIIILFSYGFVSLMLYIAQRTTKYWINEHSFHYKALFTKGSIPIAAIYKLEVNVSCWQSGMPATSNIGGIYIYFNRFDSVYISPADNELVVSSLTNMNINMQIIEK